MRRKDRQMPKEWAINIVDKCEWATLSTIDTDGMPYCIPLSIARIDNVIYFHCAKEGKKIDCFRQNNQVCISCVGDTLRPTDEFTTKYESAIIRGKIFEVLDDNEKIAALRAICQRHTPANMPNFDEAISRSLKITAIWKVIIEDVDGKRRK
ncbi:MAG: 5-nitroimidazole antibiotic resistance protein [Clostridia bacterium]|nr:5-nitroimidazole antibiotic resistance protein [Clostridia bacterium]